MIEFNRFVLNNGLRVIVHRDTSTPIVAVNVLYNVGAKDEQPDKTGFAHLFEHLMFGGSLNVPKYDEPVERVGGENNAFTNNDVTVYHLTLPKQNLETALWLESDRMMGLAFSKKSLDVQKNVVVEEFKQVYLNQPYGDVWLLLRPLAYKVHSYQWPTIGKDPSHIETATLDEVKAFFAKFYCPSNAILTIAGDVELNEVKSLVEKWFASIPSGNKYNRNLMEEPKQTESHTLSVERDVPYDAIYKAFHMCARGDKEFYTMDLLSDILSNGESSRFTQELMKKQRLFSEIEAYISGDIEKGLLVISGKLIKGVKMKDAEEAINKQLQRLKTERVDEKELMKVKNKVEAGLIFSELKVEDKAINLSFGELLGDPDMINKDIEHYLSVTSDQIMEQANVVLDENNSSTLYYFSKNK